jgi:PAS domain S-box-containing protein
MPDGPGLPNTEKLRELQFLLEEMKDVAVFSMDLQRVITSWSPGVERVLGYSEIDFVGQDASVLFTPEDRAQHLDEAEFARARADGRAPDMRWHMRKNGSRVFVDGALRMAFDDDGQHIGYTKIVRDINPKGVGEHILGTILERTTDAIYIHDQQGRYAYVNTETARMLGREPEAIIGHSLDEFFPPDIGGAMHQNNASIMATKTPRILEEQMLTHDHSQRTLLVGKAPWQDSEGKMIGVVSICQDISARKGIEEERERLLRELRRSNEELAQLLLCRLARLASALTHGQQLCAVAEPALQGQARRDSRAVHQRHPEWCCRNGTADSFASPVRSSRRSAAPTHCCSD